MNSFSKEEYRDLRDLLGIGKNGSLIFFFVHSFMTIPWWEKSGK